MKYTHLKQSIYNSILSFANEDGINASGKEEIYGCIFGRDSFITILKLLKVCSNSAIKSHIDTQPLLTMSKTAIETLITLQGRETNIESGEEPGKFIHEYRKERHEHLTGRQEKPWYLYPDNVMRIYDSIDSTPLGLIAIHRYWKITKDDNFLLKSLSAIEAGLNWIISYGDSDKDILLEYELDKQRIHGGLPVQSWTDSVESMTQADGSFPLYPIAPVEAQGYAWLALRLWADYYNDMSHNYAKTENFGHKLRTQADQLKKRFNDSFMFESEGLQFPAQALDGDKNQIKTVTGNPMLLLWATYKENGKTESILYDEYVNGIIQRSFMSDMFEKDAGIRTMSTKALTYISGQNSYHNGSFWPKLNGMSHEGLVNWDYKKEAKILRAATIGPIEHFGSPIELYVKMDTGEFLPYQNEQGQEACKQQAWSAAAALDLLTSI